MYKRQDKDTSGLLVIAKTEEAKTKLSSQFFHKTSSRKYVAVCWGNLENDNGTIIGNIGRSISNRKIMGVFPEGSDYGKHAVTHYHVLERLGYVSLVECRLETGRTHQIRVQMAGISHPVYGDMRYGGALAQKGKLALWAYSLAFSHPVTKERLRFLAYPPESETPWKAFDIPHAVEIK